MSAPVLTLPPGGRLEGDGAFTLQSGHAEVFALTSGERVFLTTRAPGDWVFPDPALLVLLPEGGAAQPRPTEELRQLAGSPFRRGDLIGPLEQWLAAIAGGAAARIAPPEAPARLAPGDVPEAASAFTPARATLWCGGADRALFGAALPSGPVLPVPPNAWALAAEAPKLVGTPQALGDGSWRAGVTAFHAGIAAALEAAAAAGAAARAQRLSAREAEVARNLALAGARMVEVLTRSATPRPPPEGDAVWALRHLAPQVEVPPDAPLEATDLADLAERCGLHARRVTLSGRWWLEDRGRLLTRRLGDGKPAALLPDWRGRPRLHAQGEPARPVDAALAETLDPAAVEVLQPLPAQPMSISRLVGHGMALCRDDIAVIAFAALAAALLGLALPYGTSVILGMLVPQGAAQGVMVLGAALVVLSLGQAALGLCAALTRTRMDGRLAVILQAGVLDRALRLPLAVLRSVNSADLTLRVLAVDQLRRMVTRTLLEGVLGGVFGLSSLVLLFSISPSGGLAALGLLALLLAAGALTGAAQLRAIGRGEAMTANLGSITLQMVQNIVTLRAFGAERRAFTEWLRNAAEMRRRMLQARFAMAGFEAGIVGFHDLALMVAYMFLALGATSGRLEAGAALAFIAAFQGFLATSEAWSRALMQIIGAQPLFERSAMILRTPPEVVRGAVPPGPLSGRLSFNGVAFAPAPEAPPVLADVSFSVAPGAFVAITGASGSGKSTLLALALGFARPDRGTVLYGDKDLATLDLAAVRRQIGVVRQGAQLLGGSVLENIRGMHACSIEEAWHAAEMAAIADDIRTLPMGMHTAIVDGASTFSGGQVQRLVLARALAGKPRLLVLDEATSALDNLTQARVVRNLESLGIARLVVAHRLSTVERADEIHFLHEGRLAESGGFEALMRAGGRFADFARRQTL